MTDITQATLTLPDGTKHQAHRASPEESWEVAIACPVCGLDYSAWIREVVDQCQGVGCPVFVKQLGACYKNPKEGIAGESIKIDSKAEAILKIRRLQHPKGGDISEWPEALQVREVADSPAAAVGQGELFGGGA